MVSTSNELVFVHLLSVDGLSSGSIVAILEWRFRYEKSVAALSQVLISEWHSLGEVTSLALSGSN